MIQFSLLCPSRSRVNHLERLICSLRDTAKDYSCFEILFAIDTDDIISQCYLNNAKERFPMLQIQVYSRERSDWLNRDYYNWLEKKSQGEFVWLIGDDLIFIKQSWDEFLLNEIENYFSNKKDRVVYVNVHDDTPIPEGAVNYANFPIISKEAIRVVGYFFCPQIPSWSSDFIMHQIYSHANIERVLDIKEPLLKHVSPHTRVVEEDESTQRQREFQTKYHIQELLQELEFTELPIKRGALVSYLLNYRSKK